MDSMWTRSISTSERRLVVLFRTYGTKLVSLTTTTSTTTVPTTIMTKIVIIITIIIIIIIIIVILNIDMINNS